MFGFRSSLGPVDLAFTDRFGGVSAAPYGELNLALDDGDDAEARAENLRLALSGFAPDLAAAPDFDPRSVVAQMRQVHGSVVEVVEDLDHGALPDADALVSTRPDVVLMVRVADCLPVLLADIESGVIGAAHAGRLGIEAGILPATVERMRELGAGKLTAWIGPHICGSCYEVPASMRAEVSQAAPAAWAQTSWGTPSLDLGRAARDQLRALGAEVIEAAPCTRESAELYSHRRDAAGAGRLAGFIRRNR